MMTATRWPFFTIDAPSSFATRAAAQSADIDPAVSLITLDGRDAAGDGGGCEMIAIGTTAPVPVRAWHLQAGGRWWRPSGAVHAAEVFGIKQGGIIDNTTAARDAVEFYRLIGGGEILFTGGKTYLFANEVNWNTDNLLVKSIGGRAIIRRNVLVNFEGVFHIRATSAPVTGTKIIGFVIEHFDAGHLTYVATAGQTVFAAPAGGTNAFDHVVFRGDTLQQPQSGQYTFAGGNITVSPACTVGEIITIKRVSASALATAALNQGFSATQPNVGVEISDIDVVADGSLYIGVEHLWHKDAVSRRIAVRGVANRGFYNYGRGINFDFGDGFVIDGRAVTGSLAINNRVVTDYGYDCNAYDASNGQTGGYNGRCLISYCLRGLSALGDQSGTRFGGVIYNNVSTYGCLIQESATAPTTERVEFDMIRGQASGSIGLWCMVGNVRFRSIDIAGAGAQGAHFDNGTVGSIESNLVIDHAKIAGCAAPFAGLSLRNQIFPRIGSAHCTANLGLGALFDAVQYATASITASGNSSHGIDLNGTSFRNDVTVMSAVNTGSGVNIQTSAFGNEVRGRCYGNTAANVADAGTASFVANVRTN
jgi:hypothetical protein